MKSKQPTIILLAIISASIALSSSWAEETQVYKWSSDDISLAFRVKRNEFAVATFKSFATLKNKEKDTKEKEKLRAYCLYCLDRAEEFLKQSEPTPADVARAAVIIQDLAKLKDNKIVSETSRGLGDSLQGVCALIRGQSVKVNIEPLLLPLGNAIELSEKKDSPAEERKKALEIAKAYRVAVLFAAGKMR